MTWDSRMRATKVAVGMESVLCRLLGHDTEVVDRAWYKVEEPKDATDPKPEVGKVFFEQPILLHWISDVEIEHFRCKRCGSLWRREVSHKNGPPKKMSQWGVMQVSGRVIPPPEAL